MFHVEQGTPPALEFLELALAEVRAQGLLRERPPPRDGSSGVSFCSNDYLALAQRPSPPGPCGAGASRLVAGDLRIHGQVEAAAAELVSQPGALVFTSGYAANMGLLPALAGPGDLIVSDALNHASLIDGTRLSRARVVVVPHLDVGAVARALGSRGSGRAFVVTESYFGMDADAPDLRSLRALCDEWGAGLIVDEAHALGVLGPEGRGLCAEVGVRPDALVGTFGKAFGAAGAFVAGCPALISWLWNRARPFVFSTALSPAVAAAALDGLQRARNEPERREMALRAAKQMRNGLGSLGAQVVGFGHVIPWVVGEAADAMRLASGLQALGVDVRAIRPPSVPAGTARLRLTVTAALKESDVEFALGAIEKMLRDSPGMRGAPRAPAPHRSAPVAKNSPHARLANEGRVALFERSSVRSGVEGAADGSRSSLATGPQEPPSLVRGAGGGVDVRSCPGGRGKLVLITGTGTAIGKTHFAEALLGAWRRLAPGARLVGLKPIESGVGEWELSDEARLTAASTFHVKRFGYAFSAPVSPHLAAREEGVTICLDRIVQFVDDVRRRVDGVVVELPGGLFTPVTSDLSNADLAAALRPDSLLLVAPDRLGVLHEVIATTRAANGARLPVDGVVLVSTDRSDASTGRNASELPALTGVAVVATLPRASVTEISELPALTQLVSRFGFSWSARKC